MPIAILKLPPTWESSKKVNLPITKTKLGDGNEQIIAEGTITEIQEWDIRSPLLTPNETQDKLDQLRAFSGVSSFYWSPDNELTIANKLFTCEGWRIIRLGVSTMQIDATFTQFV